MQFLFHFLYLKKLINFFLTLFNALGDTLRSMFHLLFIYQVGEEKYSVLFRPWSVCIE